MYNLSSTSSPRQCLEEVPREEGKKEAAEVGPEAPGQEAKRANTFKLYAVCCAAMHLQFMHITSVAYYAVELQSHVACGLAGCSGVLHWRQGAICSKRFNSHPDRGTLVG